MDDRIANPSFNESCGPSLTYFTLSAVRTSVSFLLLLRQLARPVESSGLDETLTIGLSNSGEYLKNYLDCTKELF